MLKLITVLIIVLHINGDQVIRPHHLRIEHVDVDTHSDIVIVTQTPHFSWQLDDQYDDQGHLIRNIEQKRYQIVVTMDRRNEMVWDSGDVSSSSSTYIHYEGVSLLPDTRYTVNIKYSTEQTENEWFAQWIGSEYINMNQIRTVINLKSTGVQSAPAFISGIGYYQLFIEDQLIDPSRRLDVGWTTYQQRTLYTSYDLTNVFNTSVNQKGIGIILCQGWYNKQQWAIGLGPRIELSLAYGPPRTIFQLNIVYVDGTNQSVLTDTNWLGREGEHRFDSVYMGTTVDLRAVRSCWSCANFTDPYSLWTNASILASPVNYTGGGQLSYQMMDPIRIGPNALNIGTSGQLGNVDGVQGGSLTDGGVLKPISQRSVNGQLFDLGQNFAGWCRLSSINAARSTIIQLRHGELLYSRGENGIDFSGLFYENLQSIALMDTVILNGTGNETFEPPFTYHGFRYFLVNGYDQLKTDNVECYAAHSETKLIGNFTSSSQVLNQIQHNILWSQLSNSMSLPTDCPQRNERRGWMGDAGLSIDETLFNFDYVNFYLNFLTMIKDYQLPDGAVSDTVPYTVGYSPVNPNWGTAYVTITWFLFEHTGDVSIIDRYYEGIQAWIDCLTVQYQQRGLAHFYHHWGDWEPAERTANQSLVSSYPYLHDGHTFISMSQLLNRTENIEKYTQLYQRLAEEYHRVFYNSSLGAYIDGSQAMNILPLSLPGVVPQSIRSSVLNYLVNNVIERGYFTGGIVSVNAFYPLLSKEGHHDLALKLAQNTSYPSYGYMFNNPVQNATTTWEQWNTLPQGAYSSLNHHMFNSIGAWFYRYVAGIHLNALQTITVHPRMSFHASLLTDVDTEVVTIKGSVRVQWTRVSRDVLSLSVSIPNNAQAIVSFDPLIKNGHCVKLMCDNEVIWMRGQMNSSQKIHQDPFTGVMSIPISSGKYHFLSFWEEK